MLWWMAGEPERLGTKASKAIEENAGRAVVSAVTVWEIAIKRCLGKLDAPADLREQLERARVEMLPITPRHANRVGTLPMHHRDPFDRLLIAQAEIENLPLATADGWMAKYGIDVIW